ncbi:hypothetical protein ACFQZT_32675 [Paenibacillus sp. GCM10027628]|uniref:hypothetical protein n=1 Tax=Paenibacillus sp. GCM10027628 TaxID=3273413 RepID=UPI00363D1A54
MIIWMISVYCIGLAIWCVIALLVDGNRAFVGENGLAVNGHFIDHNRILHGFVTEGTVDQIEFMLKEHADTIKIKLVKRTASQPLEEILQKWLSKNAASA